MKKIGGYPHNGYPTDMDTDTRQIFIQYVGAITRTLPTPLTSLSSYISFRCEDLYEQCWNGD